MKTRFAVLMLASLALTSCIPDDPSGPIEPMETYYPDVLPQRDLYSLPSFSGMETKRGRLITDSADFQLAWDSAFAHHPVGQKPMLPPIDFHDRVVLVASAGTTPTQLLWFRIAMVRKLPERLEVYVESVWPCGGQPVTTTPVHIVSVPRAATQAVFTFIDNTARCP